MDAVILDFDGTIVDTEPLHERALRAALEPFGVPVRKDMTIGLSDEDAIRIAYEQAGLALPDSDVIHAVFKAKVEAFIADVSPEHVSVYPGAVELARAMGEAGIPIALCTAAMRDEVDPVIDAINLRPHLRADVCADDVVRKKPAPDAYRLACERLGVEPTRALAIEDSPRGVDSAVDAGLVVIAVGQTTPRKRLGRAHAFVERIDQLSVEALRARFNDQRSESSPSGPSG
jgi:beta-phosphoglucomutase